MISAGGSGNSREFLAKHESGHAVGFLSLGWALDYVTIAELRVGFPELGHCS